MPQLNPDARPLIWIVEDDPGCRFVYEDILSHRHPLQQFETLAAFRETLDSNAARPRLIIADLKLPDGCFLNWLGTPQATALLKIPLMVISSVDDVDALRFCFEEGALDYLVKPFKKSELLVKLESILARNGANDFYGAKSDPAGSPPVYAHTDKHLALWTHMEFRILSLFDGAAENKLSRETLVATIWHGTRVHAKTPDVHIYNIRRKIEKHRLKLRLLTCSDGQWQLSGDGMHPELFRPGTPNRGIR